MLAIILIGGQGTRLRPFTCSRPKPLLPLVNRPFLEYQFDTLKAHGIKDVVLCTSYLPGQFKRVFGDGRKHGLRLSYVHEVRPLGTGGAVRNCARLVAGTFLVFNGDILSGIDLTAFLGAHGRGRAEASIALTRVKDPTLYGLVETEPDGRVRSFLEKPSWDEIRTNTINAGAYVFEPGILDLIPEGVAYSLERGLFPRLLELRRRVVGWVSPGYWMDIGTVEKYLQAHLDILSGLALGRKAPGGAGRVPLAGSSGRGRNARPPVKSCGRRVRLGRGITWPEPGGTAVLGDGTSVNDFVRFSGHVCVGPGCVIGRGAMLEDCVVLERTRVGPGASLKRCVVGERCRIGANTAVAAGGAVAGGSVVGPFSAL
ncbi:MAG: NDP-sugar synthase [Elusimicrobia bacterium]|nr:NDP-sugar synthase [Elusimicrobiota bacterium]